MSRKHRATNSVMDHNSNYASDLSKSHKRRASMDYTATSMNSSLISPSRFDRELETSSDPRKKGEII